MDLKNKCIDPSLQYKNTNNGPNSSFTVIFIPRVPNDKIYAQIWIVSYSIQFSVVEIKYIARFLDFL